MNLRLVERRAVSVAALIELLASSPHTVDALKPRDLESSRPSSSETKKEKEARLLSSSDYPPLILPKDEVEPTYRRGNEAVGSITGVPATLYRVDRPVVPRAEPHEMARQYLKENVHKLHLDFPDLGDLEHVRTRTNPGGGHVVRFGQTYLGVPVYKSQVAVTIDRRSRVTYVASTYKPGVHSHYARSSVANPANPRVTPEEATAAARAYLQVGPEDLSHESKAKLVFYRTLPQQGGAPRFRLAWEYHAVPHTSPIGDFEVLLDAASGDIFKVDDISHRADGNGNVFDPDPLSSARATYGDPGFVDGSDADTAQLNGQLQNVVLRDLTFEGGLYKLSGPWAEIVDTESPRNGLYSQASPTFNFNRQQDGFEAVNCYYHVDNIMRYINVDLGVTITPYQYSGGARFDPHGLNGSDNSHYTGSNGVIAFGEGGVDDAEDADVVIHELGHALHDWVTGGSLSQVEGLSEGSGDYLAASYSRSLDQWTPADPQYNWVFKWDGHNPFWGGRITNYGATYPSGLVGQIHTDGQIWSTCNMKIWDAIGRDKTDRAFWAGLGMTGSGTNQEDAAQAVLDAAVNMGYSGADVATIESIYQSCGYSVTAPCAATCGNGVIECDEICDGADLGGATCAGQGCDATGTLACNPTCDGLDTAGCTNCPICDNNGVCDAGEDCDGCPDDCPGGITTGAVCGNGICEAGAGDDEDCVNCPQDCNGQQGGRPSNRFCCGNGASGTGPLSCSDSTCSSGGWSCTDTPVQPGSYCCGDLVCDIGESCSNCPLDCTLGSEICDSGIDEDCDGAVDCADADCAGDPVCDVQPCSLGQPGDACTQDFECCSNNCKGNGTCK